MIIVIVVFFLISGLVLALLMSYELRLKLNDRLRSVLPSSKQKLHKMRSFAQQMNLAASSSQTQQHWHLQQWWILIAGGSLFSAILVFALTRDIDPTQVEADYLKAVDPQIYALLNGEVLTPPPEVNEQLVNAAIVEAMRDSSSITLPDAFDPSANPMEADEVSDMQAHLNTSLVDRKWDRMNPRYKQRLLMVFKIMKQRHNYELVLLEGYRSPTRQNMLAGNANITRAGAYQSFHQYGLAADVAFKRDGKVVISERDAWAMQGYQLYGQVAESVGLTWGGRWKSIKDFGHTEYRMPGLQKTKAMAEQLSNEGQTIANQ
ncbi:peptidoglycan L-alanyl-D-glutamate endopeptidase CwlK [Acinetobacter calcoaceticus]|uniref:Peptidoglycan L-alanyl-D-glutamate endopeptidase CwlK n=1 Tax=Acinetobacter calcoaceticus TaxID=471 RepID=A0A4R1Y3C5_ACICA|nr:peptidoglycan L-alanyl-D-glutamate endopeptidase CwlK [Acinetobacter calcoaceticus]